MTNRTRKRPINKILILGICAAIVVAVIAIVITLVLKNKPLDDSFFVSDNTKYVLTLNETTPSSLDYTTKEYIPEKIRIVYFYSGEEVTDLKTYYEYKDAETAQKAVEYIKSQNPDEEISDISVDGKYIIATSNSSVYEDLSAEDARQQVEFFEMVQQLDLNDSDDD